MKQKKEKTIFSEIDYKNYIPFSKIKDIVKDGDMILAGHAEGYCHSDSAMDPHYYLEVIRIVEESDEDYEKRLENDKMFEDRRKIIRYERYLELKKNLIYEI